jgi:hypothetical protein
MPLHTLAKASQIGNNQQRSAKAQKKAGKERRQEDWQQLLEGWQ